MRVFVPGVLAAVVAIASPALSGAQSEDIPAARKQAMLDKAVNYLKSTQNSDGSFSPKIAGPGVSALVAAALLRNGHSPKEPLVAKTLAYLESQVQKDG